MLIACVRTGKKYGNDYVLKLRNGVARHMPVKHQFVCFTENTVDGVECRPLAVPLPTWWSKLTLFSLGKPLIYLDLDVVITGDLSPLLDWDGFGILKDHNGKTYNSSVMKLTGKEGHVWERFTPNVMSHMHGDQDWITECMPGAKTFPPEWFPSFKLDDCVGGVSAKAMGCNFHGLPKPHQITSGWVPEAWI